MEGERHRERQRERKIFSREWRKLHLMKIANM